MSQTSAVRSGRGPLLEEIDYEAKAIGALHGKITARERRIEALEALLRFCECPKCGAELVGGIQAAEECAEAAKSIGRTDSPCSFCDTPEQSEAFAKALELVQR